MLFRKSIDYYNKLKEQINNAFNTLDKIGSEFRTDYKLTETTTDWIYELNFPGYASKDLTIEIFKQPNYGLLSLVIIANNPRYGKKLFQTYIESNIETDKIEASVDCGILYVVIPRVHEEKLIANIPVK